MAREHPAGNHQVHPRGLLTYALAEIGGGPWPGRLAIAPLPRTDGDFAAIRAWGAGLVLSLVEEDEAERAGAPELSARFEREGLVCLRAPLVDYGSPDEAFETHWWDHRDRALALLEAGNKVLVHCRGGQGRSGTIAAALMIAGGMAPAEAIAEVRRSRPAAIETAGQEIWLSTRAAIRPS
ncbi:protein-tyrosine phosphatase family protein [Thalassobaculum litoreum]|uniref:phosphatase domain-containing protein n=1 Tax=Thalassobaculum litoreum TaxID=420996 RepID=UPI000B877C27|nr:protein-tyrosine phosphatase family protein [Thalassobaculum litoreum]